MVGIPLDLMVEIHLGSIRKTYMKTSFFLSFAIILLATPSTHAQQERGLALESSITSSRRIALVIGNGTYTTGALKNPPNDATDMATALSKVGFTVEHGINLTQRQMKAMIREFGQKLKAGGQGLFYFAGHGVQLRGRNYLIPVDAEIISEADMEDQSVDVNLVMGLMDEAGNGLNVIILDACRNNPFARSFRSTANGLAQMDAPTGTLVAYSTAPGRVARDGTGRNGAYTAELLKQIRVPGLPIEELMKRVRGSLKQLTNGEQVPWESSSLVGDFYLNTAITASGAASNPASTTSTSPILNPAAIELSYWDSVKTSADPEDFKNYLAKYPNGHFADIATKSLNNLTRPAKPEAESPPASRSYTDLMGKGKAAVTSGKYDEAGRFFNEAAAAEAANPEPYEQIGKLYWEKAFSADGSDLNKAEQAYVEAIKRGGKAVIKVYRQSNHDPEITITIIATKAIFAERQGEYAYETDYDGLVAKADRGYFNVFYSKESGKFFKASGKGKPDTRELNLGGFYRYLDENRGNIYFRYKLSGVVEHTKLRAIALANIINTVRQLSSPTK
jgi:hypothetical protein